MWRLLFALLVISTGLQPASAADNAKATDPAAMILQLGASGFAEREAAARTLTVIGESAIAPLELAAKNSNDAEIRSRAGKLAAEIRIRVESAKQIATKTVTLDYTDTPLATVINELRQRTGIPVSLDPNGVKDPLRRVTVKSSGPIPMWEAVEVVAEATGLREVFRSEIPITSQRNNRRTWDEEYGQIPNVNPNTVPILLADGKPLRLPGSRDSAVRILALPPSFPGSRVVRGSGEAVINLDITPAAGVNWSDVIGIQVHRAEDETGRPISASRLVEMTSTGNGQMVWVGGGFVMINNNYYYGNQQRSTAMPNPRVVPLTLRTDDRASTKLTAFEGTVVAEATIPNVEVLKHENIEAIVNAGFDAGIGQRITVADYAVQKDGTTKLRIRVEHVPVMNRRRGGMAMNQLGGMAFAVSNNMSDGSSLVSNCSFLNADGKPVAKPKAGPAKMVESNFGYSQEVELTFAKDNKPMQMSVKGTKSILLEIPFKMANVPLP